MDLRATNNSSCKTNYHLLIFLKPYIPTKVIKNPKKKGRSISSNFRYTLNNPRFSPNPPDLLKESATILKYSK